MCKCIRSSEPFLWVSVKVPVTLEVKTDGWRNKTYYIDHGLINYGITNNLAEAEKIYFEIVKAKQEKDQSETKQCRICRVFCGTLNAADICNRCYGDPRKIIAYIENLEGIIKSFRDSGCAESGEKSNPDLTSPLASAGGEITL